MNNYIPIMAKSTIFHSFHTKVENLSLLKILQDISSDKYKDQIENIRDLISQGKIDDADRKKKLLPAFTPSGTFDSGRKAEKITSYNSHIILDFDKLSKEQLSAAFQKASSLTYTFAAFISPSGNGLKIIVLVNSGLEQHQEAYKQVADHYSKELGLIVDSSGKDVSRLCFMSYDPLCYRQFKPTPYNVNLTSKITPEIEMPRLEPVTIERSTDVDTDYSDIFNKCIEFTNKKAQYFEGNRNNYIHLLACNTNRLGVPEDKATKLITQNFDFNPEEIRTTIHSAYSNNTNDFAKFAKFANLSEKDETLSKDEMMLNMPSIPASIFDKLPNILKNGCSVFQDQRERDVFLIGAFPIISGCMRNVKGLYRGKEHYANLNVFIIAPAASGKGTMVFSKMLGDKYHDKLVEESKQKLKVYEIELAEYKKKLARSKTDTSELEPPVEPPFKVLFIPANNSSARVIQHLQEGDENGIFCETEADTMGNVFKQDWGSYSDLLRKAFHHEPISYSRKTNKEWVEIKKPRLSVALAGTPGQVENLIKSAEDGLFSRFIFYVFKSEAEWVDACETIGGVNLSEHFTLLSADVLSFVEFIHQNETMTFKLTSEQWTRLNNYGKSVTSNMITFISEDMASTSKRLGLILYRICMIITALRYFDNGEITADITCTDDDFDLSLQIIMTLQEHSILMFKDLPKSGTVTDKVVKLFFDALPESFKRKEAIEIAGERFNIKERTADLYLSKLVAFKWLDKSKAGDYYKLKSN
ncbi:MAG: DUF3987 domain-containing protein [Saprospiraceae bacterium]|nr:DUF3987 domain-containing protein [Saprospiraceae bacterium]